MENVRKYRDIKLTILERRKTIWCQNQIILLQSFSKKLLAIEMKKILIVMDKPVYLGLSIQ